MEKILFIVLPLLLSFGFSQKKKTDEPNPMKGAGFTACPEQGKLAQDYPIRPVPFNEVVLLDDFWLPRLTLQAESTVPHAMKQTLPAVERLRLAGAFLRGEDAPLPQTHRYISSDLFKVMEGAAYTLMIKADPELEKELDEIIELIDGAMEPDGYLYISHTVGNPNPKEMGDVPYSWVVHSHELYNLGHMYEGAIAYYQATGKDAWLKIAERSAQHFNRVIFEGGDPKYNNGKPVMQAPGHEELELALAKLYRVTGNKLYLDMAKKFLDIRGVTYRPDGEGVMSPTYAQQHKPVIEQDKAVGHAVRAGYLYAAMADVSALTGDIAYAEAATKIWHDIVDKKMHIIGGLGAAHGIEGFGPDYDLPNRDTYNETCAAVANVMFNYRMFLIYEDAKYFDVAEISLLNNSLAGMSMSGDEFFYVNVLETDGVKKFNHGDAGRAGWFGTACCPSNLARLMPQISGFMYAHTDADIYLTLYGSSQTEISLSNGDVELIQAADYPFDGIIKLVLNPKKAQKFGLKLRLPTWSTEQFVPGELYDYVNPITQKWSVSINGEVTEAAVEKGFITLDRTWNPGDEVELILPMEAKYSIALSEVKANNGRIAVTRGPLVYCAEEADNDNDVVQRYFIPTLDASKVETATIKDAPLRNIVKLAVPAKKITDAGVIDAKLNMVPYYAWNNRGEKSMIVWTPTSEEMAAKYIKSDLLASSPYGDVEITHTAEGTSLAAVFDSVVPKMSDDQKVPHWSSLPFTNRRQDVTFSFDGSKTVNEISVFWYEDTATEAVFLPRDWWVDYQDGDGEWKRMELKAGSGYGLKKDQFNTVKPAASFQTTALRIVTLPVHHHCQGIHEIQLELD
jgi:hypothetical protein